jgi:hypothetical protein
VQQKHLAAIEVTAYNPTKDSDGRAAKLIIDLLAEVLAARLDKLNVAAVVPVPEISGASAATSKASAASAAPTLGTHEPALAEQKPGEAWSSDSLDTGGEADAEESDSADDKLERSESSSESDESPS